MPQIAPSTYHARKACPTSDAELADAFTANTMLDLWRANSSLYGADKLATAMRKAGHDVGRDQVARLMKPASWSGASACRYAPSPPLASCWPAKVVTGEGRSLSYEAPVAVNLLATVERELAHPVPVRDCDGSATLALSARDKLLLDSPEHLDRARARHLRVARRGRSHDDPTRR